jgi:hypothetical protein
MAAQDPLTSLFEAVAIIALHYSYPCDRCVVLIGLAHVREKMAELPITEKRDSCGLPLGWDSESSA